ncbi:MAG: PAS domain S-box protein [Chloroflexi bacterium]|nr:PAS domain S-box protein [Chloroflexota bacterium]
MNNSIRILHLEDDALDAELVRLTLESAGIVCQIDRVQNRDEFTQTLQQVKYDIILGDYRLPTYDGVSALRLAQELRPNLPFIFVSGTLGEGAAIDGFTQGATDYVLKQNLSRLTSAVQRALREAGNQRLRQQAEAALQERVRHSQSLLRLSRQLERAQTYREVVNAALAEVQTIIGYQNLWVYLLTPDRQYCTALMADGQISESIRTGEGIALLKVKGDPMLEEIAAATQIVIVEDARLDPRTDKAVVAQLGNRTIVNVPILMFDQHLGSVGTGSFGDEGVRIPTRSEQEYLMAMASHMAVSLDRLHLTGQRRQAEEALRDSEQKFRSFVQESSEGFTLVDEQGTIIEWNHAREKMTGLAASQALGRLLWDVQHEMLPPELRTPERRERTRLLVLDALRTGQSPLFNSAIEAEVLTQAGERRFVQQIIFPIKTDPGYRIGSVTSDITARKQAEMQLLASEQLFRALVENSPDSIARYDRTYRRIYVNPAIQQLFSGLTENVIGETPASQSPVYAPQVYIDHLQQVIETATESTVEMPYRTPRNEMHWGHMRFVPEFGSDGKVASVLAIGRDIHDIKENERRFRMLAENFPDFVVRFDRDGRHVYVNPAVEKAFDLPATDLVGKTLLEIPRYNRPEQTAALLTLIRQAFDEGVANEAEATWDTETGERIFEVRHVPEKDATGNVVTVLSIAHDITGLKRAERERLTHLRFLESLDQVNRAMQGTNDLEQMMREVLDAMLSIFGCDRAWLTYPCDPETTTWQVPMERTRPEYPGVLPIGVELPIDPPGVEIFRILRSAGGPVKFGPGSEHPVPDVMIQAFNIQSFMATAIYPKVGTPWTFGMHQCSYPRIWLPEEERLFQEIGRRLSDTLTGLLMYRNLRESEQRFSTAFRFSPIAISIMRAADGRFVDVNNAFVQTSGYTREEIIGRTSAELDLWADPEQPASRLHHLQAQGLLEAFEFNLRTRSGEIRTGLSATAQIDLGGEKHNLSLIQDITDRMRAEARILRLNRLYATLSQINQTIVHMRDRALLFEQICRVAVEYGQFRLAWIGLTDEATGQIVPAVFAGEELGYLAMLPNTYRDEQQGRGPTGTAIREGRCVICQDIATDPGMQPWRDAALQRGYRSSAAVPIRQNAQVVGALTVYAAEPHSLDTEDESLLDEIGLDISFALDGLEQEAQRQRAETELNRLNVELEQRVAERTAELARAHEHLRAILDTAGEGVVFTDSQGAIEYINPALERLTGYTADEVLGRNPRLWKSDQTPLSTHQHMWRALLRGEIWQGELINRRKDGGLYDAALTTSPVTDLDGQIVGYVGVQRDITRQKELDRLKDQFVSNVSHELRTPLANVMLHISLLTRGRPERHDIYLRTLQREAERLRKMIEDLLDLSRLDRNVTPIELAPTDIQQLLEPLALDRAALAAQRGLTLKYEPAPDLPLALSDASKLTQVVSNLLTNALNYTPPGGEVTVLSAMHRTTTQQWIAITVRDTGPGIADKDLAHLFERFYRGEAGRKTDAPGTGLGLAISHEIIERLGGRITVESEPGHGAAFTVWVKADNDKVTG